MSEYRNPSRFRTFDFDERELENELNRLAKWLDIDVSRSRHQPMAKRIRLILAQLQRGVERKSREEHEYRNLTIDLKCLARDRRDKEEMIAELESEIAQFVTHGDLQGSSELQARLEECTRELRQFDLDVAVYQRQFGKIPTPLPDREWDAMFELLGDCMNALRDALRVIRALDRASNQKGARR